MSSPKKPEAAKLRTHRAKDSLLKPKNVKHLHGIQRRDRVLILRMENEPSDLCNACLMRRRICLKYRAKDALKAIREEIKKKKAES